MTARVGVIAGDGVGPEVIAEARKVVDAMSLGIEWVDLTWGSAHYHEHGTMMPADGVERARKLDAILLGAVGDPTVPDHITLWGLLLALRQGLDLWANLRPCRRLDGVPSALAADGPFDIVFVRENSEGEYCGVGGRSHHGFDNEVAIEVSVFTRSGVERVVRHAFECASARRGLLTSATKSNASRHGYVFWDEVVADVARDFPDVTVEHVLVDAFAAQLVRSPERLDVVVASNLFGDILTDVAAAIQGGLGMAASANVAPGSDAPGIFEPVHGSAPDIAGRGIANPSGAIWSASLMLHHLGFAGPAAAMLTTLEDVLRDGVKTADIGGDACAAEVGNAVAARLAV